MTRRLELAKHFAPFIEIPLTATASDAQHLLQVAGRDFALVADSEQPQTLVQASHLEHLPGMQQQPLSSVIELLPPLIVIGGNRTVLESDEVEQFSLMLEQTDAAGLVVYQDKQVQGIVSWETIADALPLSALSTVAEKGAYEGLAGNPVIPARIYVCLKCAASDPPPPFSVPREGDEAPLCPKHWIHGPMQRKDA